MSTATLSRNSARRQRNRRRYHRALFEACESRILMSYTWTTEVADTGNATTNGTNLMNVLNGTTTHGGVALQLGDTIVLTAGATYAGGLSGFTLRNITVGTGTITIQSSAIASLPA